MLWLGLAAGSAVVPWWSDHIKGRKLPIILGGAIQFVCLLGLVYLPSLGAALAVILCFIFGFANASHMLAFSTAADVVKPSQIGTSAAIVNGIMFIVGGIMISRPGERIGLGLEAGIEPKSLEIAQYASLPLLVAMVIAVALTFYMKERPTQEHEPARRAAPVFCAFDVSWAVEGLRNDEHRRHRHDQVL